jgi:S-adenosylmethionine decarboxylase
VTAAPALAPRDAFAPLAGAGVEWVVEAFACDPERLADVAALEALVHEMVGALALTPVAPAQWHRFPEPGGVTGLLMLAESHLALHSFPEHASLCLNLFCCRPRPEWDFARGLARAVGAGRVEVRRVERRYADSDPA